MKKVPKNTHTLQTLQNHMIRTVFGYRKNQHVNMEHVRTKFKIMSVNQMSIYHTLIEAHNVIWNSSSEKIKMKWSNESENKYTLRSTDKRFLKVTNKPVSKCAGFSFYGPKLFNLVPSNIRNTFNSATFKTLIKEWIWSNIPSY